MPASTTPSPLNKEKHVRYWLRCLKTHLPTAYTPNDAQRMSLAFFILSALDLLDALHTKTTASERAGYADWILRCQHPDGGFRGFTGTMAGDARGNGWDAANLAATFFACAALVVLGEGMERVRRRECLEWVRRLQRANGSFGEGLGEGGAVEGAEDTRFCYLAAATRWFVRTGGDMDEVEDIDVEGLVKWVEASVVSGQEEGWWYRSMLSDAELARPTKEGLRKALSTRHTVRNRPLSLPGEEEPILIRVCSWVYLLRRRYAKSARQTATAQHRDKEGEYAERRISGERDQMARVTTDPAVARNGRIPHSRRRTTRHAAHASPSHLPYPRRLGRGRERVNRAVTARPPVGRVQRPMQQGSRHMLRLLGRRNTGGESPP